MITAGAFDGDGLVDLMAGNDVGHFLFVRNIGSSKTAKFGAPVRIKSGGEVLKIESGYGGVQGPTESRWGYTCPTACDWNQDGLLDILFNSIRGDVSVLLQENPTIILDQNRIPHFAKPVILKCDTMDMRLVWRTQPAVTNWNLPNGPNCIVVNDQQNRLRRYWQVDDNNVTPGDLLRLTNGKPIQMHGKRFSGQLGRTKWQAVDWDQDGNVDLLAGTGRAASIPGPGGIPDDTYKGNRRQASVLFLRNAGSNENPAFEYPRVMTYETKKLEMGIHSCSPLAIDLGRGKLDLLIGEEDGTVLYYPREKLTWPTVVH